MALTQVVKSYEIRAHRAEADNIRNALKALYEKREDLKKRETTLADAVNEMTGDTDKETTDKVLSEVADFEKEVADLKTDIDAQEAELQKHEAAIESLQAEIDALTPPEKTEEPAPTDTEPERSKPVKDKRNDERMMNTMKVRALGRMTAHDRDTLVRSEPVQEFLTRAKQIITRAVNNASVTVPLVLLPMVREEIENSSKLLKYFNYSRVAGEARIPVMGTIPEAVWTEQCAKLNELDLSLYLVEMNAYKVAGFYGVCRYLVEDSAEGILDELIFAIGRGIALALDKAFLFGTGERMPLGIATRLMQTTNPGNMGQYARPWVNLSDSNVISLTADQSKGPKLVSGIIAALGNAKRATGEGLFFAMNTRTKMRIMSELLNYNSNGLLVTGVTNEMPVLGGGIEELDFMPDGLIIGGYGKMYAAVERGEMRFETSDQVKWIEEQTLVKGAARFDGKPVQPASFVMIGIDGVIPEDAAESVNFAFDDANDTPS